MCVGGFFWCHVLGMLLAQIPVFDKGVDLVDSSATRDIGTTFTTTDTLEYQKKGSRSAKRYCYRKGMPHFPCSTKESRVEAVLLSNLRIRTQVEVELSGMSGSASGVFRCSGTECELVFLIVIQ